MFSSSFEFEEEQLREGSPQRGEGSPEEGLSFWREKYQEVRSEGSTATVSSESEDAGVAGDGERDVAAVADDEDMVMRVSRFGRKQVNVALLLSFTGSRPCAPIASFS